MRYDWEWCWGSGPAEGMRGGSPRRTDGEAFRDGQRAREQMMAADRELVKQCPYLPVRGTGTLTVVPYDEPGPTIICDW